MYERLLRLRWLGAAGIELDYSGVRLLVDPFLSRVPFRNLFFGRPRPKADLIKSNLLSSQAVLVTHPHFDHLMDVPVICCEYGATVYGSPHTQAILLAYGVPPGQIRVVNPEDSFTEGPFSVEVFRGTHGKIAGILPHAGALPARLNPPLRLRDFRMDRMYSYRIVAGGISVLLWNTPEPADAPRADILLITPSRNSSTWTGVIDQVRPKAIVPIHWDDFFSPLDRPLRPMLAPPRLGGRLFQYMDPWKFIREIAVTFPSVTGIIPEILKSENLTAIVGKP